MKIGKRVENWLGVHNIRTDVFSCMLKSSSGKKIYIRTSGEIAIGPTNIKGKTLW
jgi:hypothetical protein